MRLSWPPLGLLLVAACLPHSTCFAAYPLAQLLACRQMADGAARLACFDREAAALAAIPAAPPQDAAAAQSRAPRINPQQAFGLPDRTVAEKEVASGARAPDAVAIKSHIARAVPAADGRWVFTLDNAQVWRQLTAQGDLLAKQGDEVTVSRGWLGSYWLQIPSGRGCKVSRLR